MCVCVKEAHKSSQFCPLSQVYIDKFDKLDESLASALQNSCDQYDTGISIIAIRVTKPKIPQNILKEFEAVEAQKTHLLVRTLSFSFLFLFPLSLFSLREIISSQILLRSFNKSKQLPRRRRRRRHSKSKSLLRRKPPSLRSRHRRMLTCHVSIR